MTSQRTTVPFGKVVRLEQGLCFNKKTNHLMSETGIPLLRITDLRNKTQTKFVDAERVPSKFIATPKDIIYTRTGNGLGIVFKGREGVVHNNCFRIIPKDGIEWDYVYWYLRQPVVISQARSLAGGAAQPDLCHDAFKSILFTYPAPIVQRKIASILSAYDNLIENNLKRVKILEEMAQMIYREWFVNFRFPGHEKVKMVDSPLGKIPEGWEVKKLGDIITNIRKSTKAGEHLSNRHYVPIDVIPRKSLSLLESKSWVEAQSSLVLFEKGDILFGAMRSYFHKVVIAPFDGVTRTTCFILRPIKDIYYSYAVMRIFQDDTIAYSSKHSRGTTIPYAVWDGALVNMKVCLPTDDLLEEFNEKLSPMLEAISSMIYKITNLRKTRDLLLPKLISGELDVEGLDIKIPEENGNA